MKQEKAITLFQTKVYDACRRIPRGKVTTYKLLGEAIDCHSARAVGQALKKNPFAPEVPCHRVVASDLSLGGFAGQRTGREIERKRRMLIEEGIAVSIKHTVSVEQVYRFDDGEW